MRAVFGLGNPGLKYKLTRHNIGFLVLDSFSEKYKLEFHPSKGDYYYSEGSFESSEFFLVKPTTFMNLNGLSIVDFLNEYEINLHDLLVVVDDVNLELGKIRLRKSGGDGGHNGLKSIIYHLQNESFPRLRIGVGNNSTEPDLADYVLGKFSKNELETLKESIEFSVELIEKFISGGYKNMSDHYSKKFHVKKINLDNNEELN